MWTFGCLENTDLENADLRPQTSKTQTSKTQTLQTKTYRWGRKHRRVKNTRERITGAIKTRITANLSWRYYIPHMYPLGTYFCTCVFGGCPNFQRVLFTLKGTWHYTWNIKPNRWIAHVFHTHFTQLLLVVAIHDPCTYVVSWILWSSDSHKKSFDSTYDSVAYDPVKTRLPDWVDSRNEVCGGTKTSIVIGLVRFCFLLRQSGFHWITSDGVI